MASLSFVANGYRCDGNQLPARGTKSLQLLGLTEYQEERFFESRGVGGKVVGVLGTISVIFPQIANLKFRFRCHFIPKLSSPLLGLSDIVDSFELSTASRISQIVYSHKGLNCN